MTDFTAYNPQNRFYLRAYINRFVRKVNLSWCLRGGDALLLAALNLLIGVCIGAFIAIAR